jgi:hypothetical protein
MDSRLKSATNPATAARWAVRGGRSVQMGIQDQDRDQSGDGGGVTSARWALGPDVKPTDSTVINPVAGKGDHDG